MKKILSILLAVSLMTMSLGTVNAQIKDTAVRKDMSAKAEANTPEASQGVKSQATVGFTNSTNLKELYPTTEGEKDKLEVTTDNTNTNELTGFTASSELSSADTVLNLADLKVKLDAKINKIKTLTLTGTGAASVNKIKTLVIPAQIKTIDANAFTSLTALEKIIIENNKDQGPSSTDDGKWGATNASLKTKYMDEMPGFTIEEGAIEADTNADQAEKYGKLVTLKPLNATVLKEVNDSTETTLNGNKLALDKDTTTKTVKAEDADGFASKYTVTISDLGKPVVNGEVKEAKFTEAELATYKDTTKDAADTKLNQFKKEILKRSALKIVDADKPTEEITANLDNTEVQSLLTMKNGDSKELKVSATNATTNSTLQENSVKIKVTIANATTPETPEKPETPQEITKEVLKAEIDKAKAEAEKTNEYTETSLKSLKEALKTAEDILTKLNASEESTKPSQEEVKKAYDALVKAMDALRKPVTDDTITTESGKKVTATEIPSTSSDYKKVVNAVKSVDSSIEGADKFDIVNATVLQVLDLTVTDADKNGETVKLKLAKVTDGKKYVLAHMNADGKIDAIYEGKDNGDGTYSFSGIKAFSPFAVMEVTPKATNDSTNNNSTSKNPSTGDTTGIAIFLTLTIASATGAYVVRKKLVK